MAHASVSHTARFSSAWRHLRQRLQTRVQVELAEVNTRLHNPPDRSAWGVLVAIGAAEIVLTFIDPTLGLIGYSLVLLTLFYQISRAWDTPMRSLLLSLVFPSLIRLIGLALPLGNAPRLNWYLYTGSLLVVSGLFALPSLGISRDSAGLRLNTTWGNRRLQIAVALLGLPIGYLTYQFLQPRPFITLTAWTDLVLPSLILLVTSGFAEEFIFRGIMQRAAVRTLGRYGVLHTSIIFTIMHLSFRSAPNLMLVFGASLLWGWAVERTRSLVGVSISHGVANIVVFLIIPYFQIFR